MERRRGRRAKKAPWQKQRHKDLKERDLAQVEIQSSCALMQCWPGAARRLVTFLARPRKVTKRMPPLVSRPLSGGSLCCLPRRGDCGTRPGEAHTTRLTAGLEQSSSTSPRRVELLGAPQGGNGIANSRPPPPTRLSFDALCSCTSSSILSPDEEGKLVLGRRRP